MNDDDGDIELEYSLTFALQIFTFCAFLVLAAYCALSARMFLNPAWLLIMGLCVAALGVIIKAAPILMQALWQGGGKVGLDVVIAAVDSTLVALGGGLLASAFILKAQYMCENRLDRLLAQNSLLDVMIEKHLSLPAGKDDPAQRWHLSELLARKCEVEEQLGKMKRNK